jgi:type IV secretion system protein VirB4
VSEPLLSDHVALEDHITDDAVLMKSRGVMGMFAASGVFPDTSDDLDVATWHDRLHNAEKNIAAEDIEITIYQCRGDADQSVCPVGIHTSQFARELSEAYNGNLLRNSLYLNKIFITVQVHAPLLGAQSLRQFFAAGRKKPQRAELEARVERLNEVCNLLQAQLPDFGLRRLGYVERGHVLFSEIAESLVFALTGNWRPIGATTGRMGNAMFSETLRFKRSHIEMHGAAGTSYAAMFAMREYPVTTRPGMFHALSMAPYRNTLVQSFRFLSNTEGMKAIGRKQNKMLAAGDKAISQTAALTDAADDLMSRRWVLGSHSLVLIAFADSAKALAEVGNAAWRDLAACGLVATRMQKALQAGYLSTLPGGDHWHPRPGLVKSSNFVAMAPLYAYPLGEETGHWGPPIALFRTLAGTPFWFHWHVGDVGNTLITGVIGAGKTLLTAFLIAMTAGRARIVALDHKRGWDFLIREMGGDYAVLGSKEPNFAPLKALDATSRNIEFLVGLIRGCIGGVMTEEENRRLAIGLDIIMTLPPHERSVGELAAFFNEEPEGAGARLMKWTAGNDLGWVIDAPTDTVRFGDLNGLDVTALLENPRARGPALLYLFHRIALLLDGTPVLIPIDEGWRALIDPIFRGMIETSLRTIRSRGGVIVFITQSPGDVIASDIARVLTEMCPSQFHMANPRARKDDYCKGFGLTDGEFAALHELQPGLGMFLLRQGNKSVVAQLPLHGMDRFIRVLSAREKELQAADRKEHGSVIDAKIEEEVA